MKKSLFRLAFISLTKYPQDWKVLKHGDYLTKIQHRLSGTVISYESYEPIIIIGTAGTVEFRWFRKHILKFLVRSLSKRTLRKAQIEVDKKIHEKLVCELGEYTNDSNRFIGLL